MQISYLDLGSIHENIQKELDDAYRQVINGQWFIGEKQMSGLKKSLLNIVVLQNVLGQGMAWMRFD